MRIKKHGSAVREHEKECPFCDCVFYYTQNDIYRDISYTIGKGCDYGDYYVTCPECGEDLTI